MIEVQNNNLRGPQDLELSVDGEDGTLLLRVTDNETGDHLVEVCIDGLSAADEFLGDLKRAIEEAF